MFESIQDRIDWENNYNHLKRENDCLERENRDLSDELLELRKGVETLTELLRGANDRIEKFTELAEKIYNT